MQNDWLKKTLLIVHIPKAAGTTLRHIAEMNYSPAETFIIQNDIPAERKRLALDPGRHALRLVFGHQCHGWHHALPPGQDHAYMTILRDPVERVISLRAYCDLYGHYLKDAVAGMSVADFVTSGVTCTIDNGMTRQLCGEDRFLREPGRDMVIPHGGVTQAHFEQAKENLAEYAIVGTVKQFSGIMGACRRMFGWRIPNYKNANVTRWPKPTVSKKDLEAIRLHNELDLQLYLFARDLFEEREGAIK